MIAQGALRQASRLFSTAVPLSNKKLPILTLFTGGSECSLCDVAKADLAQVNQVEPFYLDTWNIRDPPKGASEADVKKWKRLYQYEIVRPLSGPFVVPPS